MTELSPRQRLALAALGLGYSPVAPGTVASAATAALLYGLAGDPRSLLAWALAFTLVGALHTVAYAGAARSPGGGKDPGWVVSDEVSGQALACAGVLANPTWWAFLAAFVLFRVLDIAKPWPIARLEAVAGGWGVLLDDLAAGAIAGLVVAGCLHWLG